MEGYFATVCFLFEIVNVLKKLTLKQELKAKSMGVPKLGESN